MRLKTAAIIIFLFIFPMPLLAQDADSDGMPDSHELAHGCLLPYAPDGDVDYDSDGLTSLAEYVYSPALDPCAEDTDADEKSDGAEVNAGSNPLLDLITPTARFLSQPRAVDTSIDWPRTAIWTGSEYYVSYDFDIRHYDAQGNRIPGSFTTNSTRKLFWTGSELIGFESFEPLERLNPDLTLIESVPVGDIAEMVWTGSEFGAEMVAYPNDQFVRLSVTGELIGSPVDLPEDNCLLAWTGSEYVCALNYTWVRINPEGQIISSVDHELTDIGNILWTGSSFLTDTYYGLLEVDAAGNVLGSPIEGYLYSEAAVIPGMGLVMSRIDDLPDDIVIRDHTGTVVEGLRTGDEYFALRPVWNGTNMAIFSMADNSNSTYFYTAEIMDFDGDHLGNAEEIVAGTNANDWDTDNDGVGDGYEADHACLDPLIADSSGDSDGDGLTNLQEFYLQSDACAIDSDGDGLSDALEAIDYGSDPMNTDSDGDGLSDGWETGVVVGAGPDGVIDSTVGGDDTAHDGAIWTGANGIPETTATGDDIQVIPVALPCPRVFVTDPMLADTDGDGGNDQIETFKGSNPAVTAIVPRLIKTVDTPLEDKYSQLIWTGSEYIGLLADVIITPECEAQQYTCRANLLFRNFDRFGRPTSAFRTIASNTFRYFAALWINNELWIDSEMFMRLDNRGNRIAPDRDEFIHFVGAGWNGTQVMGNDVNPSHQLIFYRYGSGAVELSQTVIPDTSTAARIRGAWNGSEYGFFLTSDWDDGLRFVRLAEDGCIISNEQISDMSPNRTVPVWTGSEYVVSFSEGYNDESGFNCDPYSDGCSDVTVLMQLDAQGQQIGMKTIPTPGATTRINGAFWLSWDGSYLGLVSPDLSADPNGECDETDCEQASWLTWMTSDLTELPGRAYLGMAEVHPTWIENKFAYTVYPIDAGSTVEPSFRVFSPDSDGDGIPDEVEELGVCTSAFNYDSDFDGTADSLEDPDGDSLVGAADPAPCAADGDGDSLPDVNELSYGTDPLSSDTDHDGFGDAWEILYPGCANPLMITDAGADPDGDGLTNQAEYNALLNPCVADTDGDGASDQLEVLLGSNPKLNEVVPVGLGVRIGAQNRVTSDVYLSPRKLVWTGSEFGLSWTDSESIKFQRISLDGQALGPALSFDLTGDFRLSPSDLDWNGSEFGLVWNEAGAAQSFVRFSRISPSGGQIGPIVTVGSNLLQLDGGKVNLLWNGDEYGLAWLTTMIRLDSTGTVLTTTEIPNATIPGTPPIYRNAENILWIGTEYSICMHEPFVRISPTGVVIDGGTASGCLEEMAWQGNVYQALDDYRNLDDHIVMYTMTITGEWLPEAHLVAQDIDVHERSMIWNGSEFGVAYFGDSDYSLYFIRVAADGDTIGISSQVAGPEFSSEKPRLAWTGSEYGLVSFDQDGDINFLRIGWNDGDGDGLNLAQELAAGTDARDWDTDGDGSKDGADCAPLDPGMWTGCAGPDADSDGLSDGQEAVIGTDPNDSDSDDDGLLDGEEYNTLGTNPLGWDSDGDGMPDGFEVANLSGHLEGQNLSPLVADGTLDFDGDGIANAHDYWNGALPSDGHGLWAADLVGFDPCGYWGDATGDGFVSPSDVGMVKALIKGMTPDLSVVYPPTGETVDMDHDGFITPSDNGYLLYEIRGFLIMDLGSRPSGLVRVAPATGVSPTVAAGDTIRIALAVANIATNTTAGFPVVFSIDPSSTGGATIFGGEGADGAGRYDLSGPRAAGGLSRVVVRLDLPGTVTVTAKIRQCGDVENQGLYCPEILLAEPVTITVTP